MSSVVTKILNLKFAPVRRGYKIPKTLSNEDALSVCDEAEGGALTASAVESLAAVKRSTRTGARVRHGITSQEKIGANSVARDVVNKLANTKGLFSYEFVLKVLRGEGLNISEITLRRVVKAKRSQLAYRK